MSMWTDREGLTARQNPITPAMTRSSQSVFLIACGLVVLRLVYVNRGILISGSDLLAVFLLPVTYAYLSDQFSSRVRLILAGGLLIWSLSLLLLDLVNGGGLSGLTGQILPVVLILVAAATFNYLHNFFGSRQTILLFSVISVFGLVQASETNPSVYTDPWKFGLGAASSLALAAIAGSNLRRVVVLLLIAALASLLLDSRSLAVIDASAALMVLAARANARSRVGGVLIAVTALAVLYGGGNLYTNFASSGELGAAAKQRYELQIESRDPSEILAIVRPELVVASSLAFDRPILGYGTRPEPSGSEVQHALDLLVANNYEPSPRAVYRLVGNGVTTHSIFFDKWLSGGLLSATLSFICVASLWITAIRRQLIAYAPVSLLLVQLTWDFIASPLVPGTEWIYGSLVGLLTLGHKAKRLGSNFD